MASIVVLLALVGLAIDGGRLQLAKMRMQAAADAAALGGVNELKASGLARVSDAARANAAANGFTNGTALVTIVVNNPPSSGYYTGDATAVEVIIQQSVGTLFMGLLGFHDMPVTARSVARRGPGPNCLYTLDPAGSGALSASGGAIVRVNCGVMVESTSATAITLSGGASLTATAVNVAGNYTVSGGAVISPTPAVQATPEADPLISIAAPSVGACSQTGYSISSGGAATISEGVYCNGISISGGSSLHLNPGTYVLNGGGLSISGNSTLTGTGVTFYNTAGPGYSYGQISLSGGATVQLRAPVSGPLTGILFFQDRSIQSGAASSITGGANSYFDGALYFPTTSLTYAGGTSTDYTIIVARRLTFSGGTVLNSDYSSLVGGSPVKGTGQLSE